MDEVFIVVVVAVRVGTLGREGEGRQEGFQAGKR